MWLENMVACFLRFLGSFPLLYFIWIFSSRFLHFTCLAQFLFHSQQFLLACEALSWRGSAWLLLRVHRVGGRLHSTLMEGPNPAQGQVLFCTWLATLSKIPFPYFRRFIRCFVVSLCFLHKDGDSVHILCLLVVCIHLHVLWGLWEYLA